MFRSRLRMLHRMDYYSKYKWFIQLHVCYDCWTVIIWLCEYIPHCRPAIDIVIDESLDIAPLHQDVVHQPVLSSLHTELLKQNGAFFFIQKSPLVWFLHMLFFSPVEREYHIKGPY